MPDVSVDFSGLQQMSKMLNSMLQTVPSADAKQFSKESQKIMSRSLREAARPILVELRAQTPKDTGALRRKSGIRGGRVARTGAIWMRVGWVNLLQSLRTIERSAAVRRRGGDARSIQAQQRRQYIQARVIEFGSRWHGNTFRWGHPRTPQLIVTRLAEKHERSFVSRFVNQYEKNMQPLLQRMAQAAGKNVKVTR